jgi:hypothetical protein
MKKEDSFLDWVSYGGAIIAVMCLALIGAAVGGAIFGVFVKTMMWVAR